MSVHQATVALTSCVVKNRGRKSILSQGIRRSTGYFLLADDYFRLTSGIFFSDKEKQKNPAASIALREPAFLGMEVGLQTLCGRRGRLNNFSRACGFMAGPGEL